MLYQVYNTASNIAWETLYYEMDGLGNITDNEPFSDLSGYDWSFYWTDETIDKTLYLAVHSDDKSGGVYKLQDFTLKNAEKFFSFPYPEDLCTDGNVGLYFVDSTAFADGYGSHRRYIYHWDGTGDGKGTDVSKIYDIGEFPSSKEAHEVISSLKYDENNELLIAEKEKHTATDSEGNGHETEARNILVMTSGGTVIQEIEGWIRSYVVIEKFPSLIEPVTFASDSDVLKRLAELKQIKVNQIKFITDDNISEPSAPTQSMIEFMKNDGYEPVKNLNVITVREDGYYVFCVNVPRELVGTKTSDIKIYALKQADFTDSGVKSSFFSLINGILNFGEITNLTGMKVDTLPEKILAIGFLQGGQPFSVYIAKILLVLLTGGCSVVGSMAVIICVISSVLFFRKQLK